MKYYKVIKEHPLWEVGAIIGADDDDGGYRLIDDIWIKEFSDSNRDFSSYTEGIELVEIQKDWFERVYKVNTLKQVKYLVKEEAKKALDGLYK